MAETVDYLREIKRRRAGKKSVRVDFKKLPQDIDKVKVFKEMTYGIRKDALEAAGNLVKERGSLRVDYAKIPWQKLPPEEPQIRMPKPSDVPAPPTAEEESRVIAERAMRALKPSLKKTPKEVRSMAVIKPETIQKKTGMPELPAELVSEITSPEAYAWGTFLGPFFGAAGKAVAPIFRAAGKKAGRIAKKAVKPATEFIKNKLRIRQEKELARRIITKGTPWEKPPKMTPDEIAAKLVKKEPPKELILPGAKPLKPKKLVKLNEPETTSTKLTMPFEQQPIAEKIVRPEEGYSVEKMWEAPLNTIKSNGYPDRFSSKVRSEMIDRYTPVYLMGKKAEEITGRVMKFDENPYYAARLYAGTQGKVVNRLNKLREILKPVRGDIKNLEIYMGAERALERGASGFGNPAGITAKQANDDIKKMMKTLSAERMGRITETAETIRKTIGREILDMAEDSGLIAKGAAEKIHKNNEFWVPFDILAYVGENDAKVHFGKKSLSVAKQNVVQYMTGAKAEHRIRRPLDGLVNRIQKVVSMSERNKVISKVAAMRNLGPEMEQFIKLPKEGIPHGFRELPYFVNGKKSSVAVPQSVADSLMGLNSQAADILTRFGAVGAAALRGGATMFNIPFLFISNPIRDFQTAAMTTGRGWRFITDYVKGFAHAIGKTSQFQEFQELGGMQAGFISHFRPGKTGAYVRQSELVKNIKTITNPLELLRAAGEIIETAPRLAAYQRTLKTGATKAQAAFTGRNATVDFARSGSTFKILNMWTPFLNARLQGALILGKAGKDKPVASVINGLTMVGMPQYATTIWNMTNYPDMYRKIPDWVKENYFIVIKGTKKNEKGETVPDAIKIPKGDIGRIFGNPIQMFTENMINKGMSLKETLGDLLESPEDLESLALKTMSDISPVEFEYEGKPSISRALASLPPPIRAAVETSLGRSFYFQRDIIPGWLKDVKTKSEQYTERTPETLKWVGKQLDMSPLKIEHFLRSLFAGGLYQVLEPHKIGEQVMKKITDVPIGAETSVIYDIKEEIRAEQADARVKMRHAITKIISGDKEEQKEGRKEIAAYMKEMPETAKGDFLQRQIEWTLGRKLPAKELALKTLSKKEKILYYKWLKERTK